MRTRLVLATVCALGLAACEQTPVTLRPDAGQFDGGGDSGVDLSGPITYYGHVRPILVANCTTCHTEGGIAPFQLETYEQAREVAERMQEVTHDRIMPPFLADNSGECQTFDNFRGLTQTEIDTVGAWVDMGTLEGDPSAPVPERAVLPTLDRVDLTLTMPPYTVDESDDDDYRCFVVDNPLTENRYVTGFNVTPGNTQRVHHVIVYNPTDESQAVRAATLDEDNGGAGTGYPCFGGPRVDAMPMVLWAPGTGSTDFPRGTGVELEAGRRQIIQVHYNNLVPDSPDEDRTTIDLMTVVSANPAFIAPLADFNLNLPPRMEEVVEEQTWPLSSILPTSVRVWGIFPHMHTLGRTMRVVRTVSTDDSQQCLLNVPRWDFNWQLAYWYDQPIRISPDDSATITCTYNTMERDETVNWGDGTQDEMCLAFIYVTI